MPVAPIPSDVYHSLRGDPFFFDELSVEQGGIVYRDREIWKTVNSELAFNGNTKLFEEALASFCILI